MTMKLVNLTPHTIVLRDSEGVDHAYPSSGVARTTATPGVPSRLYPDEIPVPVFTRTTYGAVVGLPDPAPDTYYVVSAIVGAALFGTRPDVLCPGTGPQDGAIRDDGGRIVAVTRLVQP